MGTSNVTLYAQWTLITTATINVTSNVSTGWCINATTCDTAKTTKTYTVTPGVTGSSYTIVGNTVNNYTGPTITNNVTGSGSTFILFPGDSGTFSLSYTPVGNPPCTTCNGGGFDYSLEGPASKVVTKGVPEQIVLTAKLINTPAQTISFEVSGNPAGISIQPTQCIPAWTPTCTSNINIFVDQSVALGKYTITIKGSPLANKLYKFDLDVISGGGGGGLSVTSCKADPLIQAWIGQIVKWSVVYSGGTPPYQFRWTGPGMKNDSAWLSADTYELTYSTTGKKSASVEVKDSAGSLKSVDCDASSIQIKVNPTFKEQ